MTVCALSGLAKQHKLASYKFASRVSATRLRLCVCSQPLGTIYKLLRLWPTSVTGNTVQSPVHEHVPIRWKFLTELRLGYAQHLRSTPS